MAFGLLACGVATLCGCKGTAGVRSPAVSSGEQPSWALTGVHAKYPKAVYLTAVGAGNTPKAAKTNARAELTNAISVHIESKINDIIESFTEHRETGTKRKSTERFLQEVKAQAEAELFGWETPVAWKDSTDGTIYMLAVMERRGACAELRKKILKGRATATENFNKAKQKEQEGDLTLAIKNYFRAWDAVLPLTKYEIEFRVVGKPLAGVSLPPSSAPNVTRIVDDLEGLVARVRLTVEGGDRQRGGFGERLPEPLALRVSLDGEAPVRRFPVLLKLEDGTGELSEEVLTDADGRAVCHVMRTDATGKELNRIRVWLGFEKLYKKADKLLRVEKILTYRLPTRGSTRVLVKVVEKIGENARARSLVQNEIVKALGPKGAGFKVLEETVALAKLDATQAQMEDPRALVGPLKTVADILVVGVAVSRFGEPYYGNTVMNNTRFSIRAIHTEKEKVLAAIELSEHETKGRSAGPNEEQAARKAFRWYGPRVAGKLRAKLEALYPSGPSSGTE